MAGAINRRDFARISTLAGLGAAQPPRYVEDSSITPGN